TVIDTVNVSSLNINGANFAFWIGNGYGFTGTSGVWTGSITLHGVNEIPAPGAWAIAAAAAGIGRRRRRA
ncbi:MAG: hypothetical protein JNK53_01570, partial [Phycisphaerae bacterium]|nr:hypothetical protein [Phycisphaerae bacterium]